MKKFLFCTILVFSSGCTLIPHYHRPDLPVPSQFPYTHPKNSLGSVSAYDIGWKDFFKDVRLQKLIEIALSNNRDYRVALLNVEQLRDQYRIMRYALIPTFQMDASLLRQRDVATSGNYINSSTYTADVNTSYEIDLFGHIRSLKAQVLEQYLATEEASRTAQISLVAQVAAQYLTVLAFDEQLALLRQTFDSVNAYALLVDKSYHLGNSSALDLEVAQAQVQAVNAAIANDERQFAQAQDALVLLIGEAMPADLPPPEPLANQDLMEDLPVGLSSDLIEQRPDIMQAEHQLKAANANIGAVRSAFFPSITLTASDGTASAKLAKLFTPGSQAWTFAPQISLPLFNQNTNLANLDAAQVSKRIEIAAYEKTVQEAFKEVSDAIVARDTFNAEIKAQEDLADAQQKRLQLIQSRYQHGIENYFTLALAQQDLYSAQENLIQVSLDRFTNLISLYKALGGGWKEK